MKNTLFIRFIANDDYCNEVLSRVAGAGRSLWIVTAIGHSIAAAVMSARFSLLEIFYLQIWTL